MKNLDSRLLQKFLKLVTETLEGEWVLLGGTLLPALGIDHRVTTDIDLVCLKETTNSDRLQLMNLAEKLNLPVETINPAAEFYLNKIENYRAHLTELRKGARGTVYRPSVTLYLELKMMRMSESDLGDCLEMIRYAKKNKEKIDLKRIQRVMKKASHQASTEAKKRLAQLMESL